MSVAVDGVAHFHVVCQHAFGDGSRDAAHPEKPAHHFLSRTDLGKRAVPAGIKINPERLGMAIVRFLFHGWITATVIIFSEMTFPNTRWKRRARRASRTLRCIRAAGSRPIR